MFKITDIKQLKVGDVIRVASRLDNRWWLFEIFKIETDKTHFQISAQWLDNNTHIDHRGQTRYPNTGWLDANDIFILNRNS